MIRYTIDNAHSDVGFSVRHMVFAKVRGHFTKWTSEFSFDAASPLRSAITATIDASSIDTREAQRDGHLKSADFLDVEKYPTITFVSSKIDADAAKHYKVTGALTIHGVTRDITLDVEELGQGKDPRGNDRVAFVAKCAIVRSDFGLTWNQVLETGGVVVGDRIDVEIDVQAIASAGL